MIERSEKEPLVSILVNNHNYAEFLPEAIESALNQSYKNLEVIVVDDGSYDNSREIISGYKTQVKFLFKENGGQASAFNAGFSMCQGDIVLFLDSDDVFLPLKAERVVQQFSYNAESGWLIHKMRHVNNAHQPVSIVEKHYGPPLLNKSGDYSKVARRGKINFSLPATSALCFRSSLLKEIFPVPKALKITADNYLKLASLVSAPILVIDDYLSEQRIHGRNMYTNKDRNLSEFRKLSRKINMEIAFGLKRLDIHQWLTYKMLFGVIKSSIVDMDLMMIGEVFRSLYPNRLKELKQ